MEGVDTMSEIMDALYDKFAALDDGDRPLEEYPPAVVQVLLRAGYAIVPVTLPPEVLGKAAMFDTGNPKDTWDFILRSVCLT